MKVYGKYRFAIREDLIRSIYYDENLHYSAYETIIFVDKIMEVLDEWLTGEDIEKEVISEGEIEGIDQEESGWETEGTLGE